jgi:hypothetical protein
VGYSESEVEMDAAALELETHQLLLNWRWR